MSDSVKQNYLDKIHSNVVEIGRRINVLIVFVVVISILVAGLAAGGLAVDEQFDLLGAKIKVPRIAPLLIATVALSLVLIHLLALTRYEEDLRDIVLRLYAEMGFSDSSMADRESNPLEYPNIVTTAFSARAMRMSVLGRILGIISRLLIFVLIYMLPVVAQAYAAYIGFRNAGVLPGLVLLACAVLTLLYVVVDIQGMATAPPGKDETYAA